MTERAGHEQALKLRLEGSLSEQVTSAHVVIGAAELMPCQAVGAASIALSWLQQVDDWIVPSARAHSFTHALRIGTPRVVSLTGGSASVDLGRFYAPEGAFCQVLLELSPADADAKGVPLDGGVGETLRVDFADGRESLRSGASWSTLVSLRTPMKVSGAPTQRDVEVVLSLEDWPVESFRGGDGDHALFMLTRWLSSR